MNTPPYEAYFVVEVDISHDRDNPLFVQMRGPFSTREKAEKEKEAQQNSWEEAIEEWDEGNPYDFKGWNVIKKHIHDFQIEKLERQDEDAHETMMDAVNAVGASLLAEEGIGPLSDDEDTSQ